MGLITAVLPLSGKAYFFLGGDHSGQYVRFDIASDEVDAGYPRTIAESWPGVFPDGVDAALLWPGGKAYFFRRGEYVRYDVAADCADHGYPKPIATGWPGLFTDSIDAAMLWNDGKAYFFKDDQFIRYDVAQDRADEGYPRSIASNWPGVFADGVDAAVLWNDQKAYLFSRDEYVRYDVAFDSIDSGFPQLVKHGWPSLVGTVSTAPPSLTGSKPDTPASPPGGVAGHSWVNVAQSSVAGTKLVLIGQIYFATDKDTPEDQGYSELQEIVDEYSHVLTGGGSVEFQFDGFADPRHTSDHNHALSKRRAENVRNYILERMSGGPTAHDKFNSVVVARGEAIDATGLPANAMVLAPFRRVDIYGPPTKKVPSKPPPELPIPPLHSHEFEAVVTDLGTAVTTIPPAGISAGGVVYKLQLTDLRNNRRLNFVFSGLAVGTPYILPDFTDLPPQRFTTAFPVKIENFGGWACYVQVGGGPASLTTLVLNGPAEQVGGGVVVLSWPALGGEILDGPRGLSACGTLVPSGP